MQSIAPNDPYFTAIIPTADLVNKLIYELRTAFTPSEYNLDYLISSAVDRLTDLDAEAVNLTMLYDTSTRLALEFTAVLGVVKSDAMIAMWREFSTNLYKRMLSLKIWNSEGIALYYYGGLSNGDIILRSYDTVEDLEGQNVSSMLPVGHACYYLKS